MSLSEIKEKRKTARTADENGRRKDRRKNPPHAAHFKPHGFKDRKNKKHQPRYENVHRKKAADLRREKLGEK
jgi:hypothetical protein